MPASTTKMMTCILGLENANDDDIVEVDKRAVGVEGSAIYINEGDKIKMSELLQATMLASGNDGLLCYCLLCRKRFPRNFCANDE